MSGEKLFDLGEGTPNGQVIEDCKKLLLDATQEVLNETPLSANALVYGLGGGDTDCKEALAAFLGQQYGETVSSKSLFLTAGATQGLHVLLTTLLQATDIVFMEDPCYFLALNIVRDDLGKTVIPVARDGDGMKPEVLDAVLTSHKPSDWQAAKTGSQRYWASIYFVPTFNNPTTQSYSQARFHQLVALARKHCVLLIAEDMYQFLYFSERQTTSPRLLTTFDPNTNPAYQGGHVVCNTSFSKVFASGLRLGWIEGPQWLIDWLEKSGLSDSGGCFNQYTSKLVAQTLRNGSFQRHLVQIRSIYKCRMDALLQTLEERPLPDGCSPVAPEGGLYLWLTLHPRTDAEHFLQMARVKYQVNFVPGSKFSPSGRYQNCVRLAIAILDADAIREGARRFSLAYQEYLDTNP